MITTYQIRNVLRVYGNQLKKKTLPIQDSVEPARYSCDIVDISTAARRKQMFNGLSEDIISRISRSDIQQVAKEKVPSDYPLIAEQEKKDHEN